MSVVKRRPPRIGSPHCEGNYFEKPISRWRMVLEFAITILVVGFWIYSMAWGFSQFASWNT